MDNSTEADIMINKVSIILPAYNEEGAIAGLIDAINKVMHLSKYEYEIIVVDDVSTDNTAKIAQCKGARLITHPVHRGTGAARKTGIRHASGEIIIMLDCDGTYSPEDIIKMLEFFPKYDQVIGARNRETGSLKILRFLAKWFIRKLAGYLTHTRIPDLNSGIRAFKKEIMEKFIWMIPDGFSCVSTMTLAFLCNGYSVKWLPVQYYARIGRSKFHPIKDTFSYIVTVTRIIAYFNPLNIFLPLSLILFGIGLLKSINDIFFNILPDTLYIDTVLLLASVIIFALGLIADLIVSQRKMIERA